jgi:hypothetical protein
VRRRENKNAAVQVGSLCPAFSQHARRRPQHLQPSTPSRLALDAPDLPSRGGEPMEKCGYRSVIACPAWGAYCSTDVNLTIPPPQPRRPLRAPSWAERSGSLMRSHPKHLNRCRLPC